MLWKERNVQIKQKPVFLFEKKIPYRNFSSRYGTLFMDDPLSSVLNRNLSANDDGLITGEDGKQGENEGKGRRKRRKRRRKRKTKTKTKRGRSKGRRCKIGLWQLMRFPPLEAESWHFSILKASAWNSFQIFYLLLLRGRTMVHKSFLM